MSVAALLQATTRIHSIKYPLSKECVTTRKTFLFNINAQRLVTEDSMLEATDATGHRVLPLIAPNGAPISQLMSLSSSKPFQIVPKGGSFHVSITSTTSSCKYLSKCLGVHLSCIMMFPAFSSSATSARPYNTPINATGYKDTY